MSGGNMLARRFAMFLLVIKEKIRIEASL